MFSRQNEKSTKTQKATSTEKADRVLQHNPLKATEVLRRRELTQRANNGHCRHSRRSAKLSDRKLRSLPPDPFRHQNLAIARMLAARRSVARAAR
jgi:hypothetical protein